MAELIPLGQHTYYIPGATNVGVLERGGRVCLFDSGYDEAAAKQIFSAITARGWTVDAVYNTHYHADHIGGNRLIQEQSGCRCYCPQPVFAVEPILNPAFLFSAQPPEPLRGSIFLAAPSDTAQLTQACLPDGVSMIALPGHSYQQYAFRTPDNVLFLGDSILGAEEFVHPQMSYVYHLAQHLSSLDRLESEQADWYVPGHGSPVQKLLPLLETNRASFLTIRSWILELCTGYGLNQDELLKAIFDRTHKHMTLGKYALVTSSLHAYLSDLIDSGEMIARSKENILRFRTIQKR